MGEVIQLSGDQRFKIRDFFVETGMVTEREAKEKIQMCVRRGRARAVGALILGADTATVTRGFWSVCFE